MKSSKEDLKRRGMVEEIDIKYSSLKNHELILNINSKDAIERTCSIRILSQRHTPDNTEFINVLLKRLKNEKALYTKIEICNILEKGNKITANQMIEYLGIIGKNQHKTTPDKISQKTSYPLPRDIIARTLGKMNPIILETMLDVLYSKNQIQISEILDSIGFMIFYNPKLATKNNFTKIKKIIEEYKSNDLIIWKCVICLSAFTIWESINLLNTIKEKNKNKTIVLECIRSLKLISNRNKS